MKKYHTIVADPPWDMPRSGKWTGKGGNWADYNGSVVDLPYGTMNLDEIAALPVRELAAADAHLYLWTTNRFLRDAFNIAEEWGFTFSTLLTWCKAPMGLGMGGAFTLTAEFVLFARKGSLKANAKIDSSWWQWKRGEHSAKPEAFLDLVEQVSPEPRLELFARRARFGWDYWGDQSLGTAEMPREAA